MADPSDRHAANRRGWEALAARWQANPAIEAAWPRAAAEPATILAAEELAWLTDLAGREAAVLASGDNLAAFALAGLGARVTSIDISQAQLDIAAGRAARLGLELTFLRRDVVDLHGVPDAAFDLVYTGGHATVWVADLRRYYAEATRILKPGGLLMVSEYHPVRRIIAAGEGGLKVWGSYFDRGPFTYNRAAELPDAAEALPSYEHHWTIADLVAALRQGCELVSFDEYGDGREEWEPADLSGLPQTLLLVGRKRG